MVAEGSAAAGSAARNAGDGREETVAMARRRRRARVWAGGAAGRGGFKGDPRGVGGARVTFRNAVRAYL